MSQCMAEVPAVEGLRFSHPPSVPDMPGTPEAAGLGKQVARIVTDLRVKQDATVLRPLTSATTIDEFEQLRKELFAKYVHLSMAISNVVASEVDRWYMPQAAESAFMAFTRQFEQGSDLLPQGSELQQAVLQYLDSLERALALTHEILPRYTSLTMEPHSLARFLGWVEEAVAGIFWAQMHLSCLMFAVREGVRPVDEVLHGIVQGMRTGMVAYGFARAAYGLLPEAEEDWSKVTWDDADAARLEQSYLDMQTLERD